MPSIPHRFPALWVVCNTVLPIAAIPLWACLESVSPAFMRAIMTIYIQKDNCRWVPNPSFTADSLIVLRRVRSITQAFAHAEIGHC